MNKLLDYTPLLRPTTNTRDRARRDGSHHLEGAIGQASWMLRAQCHNKIDPAGFALENFDAIGAWREKYDRKLEVDSSGKLPGGQTFSSFEEFRELVVVREETLFAA